MDSNPIGRKSRSISRYFLGPKRSIVDETNEEISIRRALRLSGIFESIDFWNFVTICRDFRSSRRILILTEKNRLVLAKFFQRQSLVKIKEIVEIDEFWFDDEIRPSTVNELNCLGQFESTRSIVIGWPPAENFIVEFSDTTTRNIWKERFQSNIRNLRRTTTKNVEHVRIVIDQDGQNSFLIRKIIGIRPEETVRDLIKKSIEAFHLRDPDVENYFLFVNSSLSTRNCSPSLQRLDRPLIGHEYPYSIKMKHIKAISGSTTNNRSFDIDEQPSYSFSQSSTSLTNIHPTTSRSHDFELRKKDHQIEQPSKKHRFFYKRRTKTNPLINDDSPRSFSLTANRSNFFGSNLDQLVQQNSGTLPIVILQILRNIFAKGPETVGIFRKVANARSVKESIEKIERENQLDQTELYPILAAGILKHFLRSLPEPIFSSVDYELWKKCLRLATLTDRISYARNNILFNMPRANQILLKGLICVLYRISQNGTFNGMNPFNLGLCISNSLFKSESTTISSGKQEADVMSSIVEFLIENSISLFGADVLTCVLDKEILFQTISNTTTASSIESLDEVESSSTQIAMVNRSHDSGLAVSDQPFPDDSSEMSEQIHRRNVPTKENEIRAEWSSSVACGKGLVLTSILLPSSKTSQIQRRRSSKNNYKPSKSFLQRETLCNDTTDDSDHPPVFLPSNKVKRSKSLSRHSSIVHHETGQNPSSKEIKRSTTSHDVKRSASFKQIEQPSDDADDDDELNETSTTKRTDSIRTVKLVEQDLDLLNETIPSVSKKQSETKVNDSMSSTRREICVEKSAKIEEKTTNERVRTFVHQSNRRTFVLSQPIQMKPMESTVERSSDFHQENSVRERAKFFEAKSTKTFSRARENYV